MRTCPPRLDHPLEDRVERKLAHSLRLLLPRMTGPAARRRATMGASRLPWFSASASEPAVVGSGSADSMLSQIVGATTSQMPHAPHGAEDTNMPTAQIAQINGNSLAFYEWGQQGSPVLICLHSHTNSAASWREFAEFASSKYHVFALDQRGHGNSEWARDGYARDRFVEDLADNMDEFQELGDHIEALNLEALKATDLKWEQQQEMKDVLEKAAEELQNLEKMAEALNSIVQEGEKHDLFSPALMDKFKELSELIQNILPEEMMNSMDELQKALNEMDMKSIQQSLSDLADNMEQIEQDLDRYLEIFRRLQAEQKMDELETRMQQLMEQQNALDQEMNRLQNEDASTLARLAQEEKRNMEELNAVEDLIEEAAEMIEPFSEKTAEDLTEFSQDPILETTEELLGKTMKNLAKQNRAQAQKTSEQSLNNMQTIMQEITDLKQQFQQETVSEMVEKFQETIRDLLYLSSQEEQLKTNVKTTSRNSPRLRDFAVQQQVLQDQLKSIMSQMMDLSKQTFAITPDIGQAMGKANAGMEEAKRNLTERQVSQAGQKQDRAMEGLNEAAMEMFNSIQQMESSGSSSGYEQFLQMMQQMAGQQQGLNQQGMQLALGQMAAAAQQQMMQQMLQKQQGIRKSLDQLMKEMKQSGTHGQGDFSGMRADMDKVIKDLQKNRFTPKTHQRQQRILSRMLDSQTSMTQRGFKEQRRSTTPDPAIVFEGPGGLPADMGQRQNLALQALNKAINAGYSREHQNMIKRYFNSLSQIQVEIRPTEADIVE